MARLSVHAQAQPQVEDYFLIALAKQGDPTAYDRIVRRYYGFVRLKASSYFLAGGDADDLIQEGLVGLYKAVRDYRTDRGQQNRTIGGPARNHVAEDRAKHGTADGCEEELHGCGPGQAMKPTRRAVSEPISM